MPSAFDIGGSGGRVGLSAKPRTPRQFSARETYSERRALQSVRRADEKFADEIAEALAPFSGSCTRRTGRAAPVTPAALAQAFYHCGGSSSVSLPQTKAPVTLDLLPPPRLLGVSLRHLALVCREGTQNLLLFALGHLEDVKGSPEFGRDFIELGGRDLQFAMGFFQAKRSFARFRGRILLGSARNVADPQGAHELEARKSAQIVGVPFPKGRVL